MPRLSAIFIVVVASLYYSSLSSAHHRSTQSKATIVKSNRKIDSDLVEAAWTSDYPRVVRLVQHGANVNCLAGSPLCSTPLVCAAGNRDNIKMIEFLIHHGAIVDGRNDEGESPLMEAAQFESVANMKVLLKYGADPNVHERLVGDTTLHNVAEFRPNMAVMATLLQNGANINAVNNDGRTPLGVSRSPDVARRLIELGANVTIKDKKGIPTWMQLRRQVDLLPLLVRHGARINDKTRDGLTCLHLAARSDDRSAIEALINLGANVNARGPHGETAYSLALKRGDIDRDDIIDTLIAAGEKDAKPIAKAPDIPVNPASDEAAIAQAVVDARLDTHGRLLFVRDTIAGKDTARWIESRFFTFQDEPAPQTPAITGMRHDRSNSEVMPDFGSHPGYTCVRKSDITDLLKNGRHWEKVRERYTAVGTETISNPWIAPDREHATVLLEFECGELCGGMEMWNLHKASEGWVVDNHKGLAIF